MRDRKTLQKLCTQDLNDSRNMYNEKKNQSYTCYSFGPFQLIESYKKK